MGKKLLSFLFVILFCISCTKESQVSPTKQKEVVPVAEVSGESDQARINYAQSIVFRLNGLVAKIDLGEYASISSDLKKCSIAKPASGGEEVSGGAYQIIKGGSLECYIVVVTEDDITKFPFYKNELGDVSSGKFASANFEYSVITIRKFDESYKTSLDYLAMVMYHEAVHMNYRADCQKLNLSEFKCRALNESLAYNLEFLIFDYLASQNQSYFQDMDLEASVLAKEYLATGNYPSVDYSNSSRMRNYFESESDFQDMLWNSVWWLRSTQQMFIRIHGKDYEAAYDGYQEFLESIYSSGIVK